MRELTYDSAQSKDPALIQLQLSTATTSAYTEILAYSLIKVIGHAVLKY
jgi:hypothetical protein